MARLYRRTEAGSKVWDTQDARVALDYRRLLGLIRHDSDPKELRAKLGCSEGALQEMLDELERQRLVKSVDADSDGTDLDFTGAFSIAELRGTQKKP